MNAMQPPQSIEEIKEGLETTEKGGVRQSIRNCLTVSSDLVFAIAGLILAVVGFFLSGIFGLIRRLIGKDHSDGKEEKGGISAEDAAYERKVKIVNTLRALFPILAFVLFGVLLMLLQGGRF